MAEIRVNPTRMELKKRKNRLMTARRGHKLLKDKRDELMRQFMEIVRQNRILRQKAEQALQAGYRSFSVAAAVSSPEMLEQALMLPKSCGTLQVATRNFMSVEVPEFSYYHGKAEGVPYGYAFTSCDLDAAVREFSGILPDLIRLAEIEKTAQMLAAEIEKTRRRVNALEYIMIPQLEAEIKSIAMKLEENERGNTVRLMKVKEMTIARDRKERTQVKPS